MLYERVGDVLCVVCQLEFTPGIENFPPLFYCCRLQSSHELEKDSSLFLDVNDDAEDEDGKSAMNLFYAN